MIYEHAKDNIESLMRTVGVIQLRQLLRFFSAEYPVNTLRNLVKNMVLYNFLKYDPETDLVTLPEYPELSKDEIARRIKAAWVFVNHGSQAVRQVYCLEFPQTFAYVTHSDIVYDISVVDTTMDAQLCVQRIRANTPPDTNDDATHIALVDDMDLGKRLADYGFDAFGILDPVSNDVRYFSFD